MRFAAWRVLRALGHDEQARAALASAVTWHRAAGGGEQAALGECLLAAMDAAAGEAPAIARLAALLDAARANGEAHVEVFALDALARVAAAGGDHDSADALCEEADRRMEHGTLHRRAGPHRRPGRPADVIPLRSP